MMLTPAMSSSSAAAATTTSAPFLVLSIISGWEEILLLPY